VADQATVSAASFLATVILGRLCGADDLGLYALGMAVSVTVVQVQTALVSAPYMVYALRATAVERRPYAGNVLTLFGLLAATALSLLGALTGLLGGLTARPELGWGARVWPP
jgi:O-antigen/teichoic acid export membrane protein